MVQRDQTLPLRVWLARLTNDTERRSKASLCNNGLLFLLCGGLRNYESIKTACRRGRKTHYWRVERKNSALLISNSTTSKRLLQVRWYFVCIIACWVCFAATIYGVDVIFAADGPSRSHWYQFVSLSQCSHQFHLGSFFRSLYFRGSRSVRENRENLHLAKISHYTVVCICIIT